VLVVIASRHDASAASLCHRAPPGTATVLSWRDLSTPGWRYYDDPGDGEDEVVIGGMPLAAVSISTVVTRCPSVPPHELGHIVPADRGYVAAEMTALLLAWLARLRCPVINRPSAGSLCGPRWHPERWTALAASLELPVTRLTRRAVPGLPPHTPGPTPPPGFEHRSVTVVGSRAIDTTPAPEPSAPDVSNAALALARGAGVALLRVHFAVRHAEHRFLSADLDVDLAEARVADALLEHVELTKPELTATARP
jgi:hypothetical protein